MVFFFEGGGFGSFGPQLVPEVALLQKYWLWPKKKTRKEGRREGKGQEGKKKQQFFWGPNNTKFLKKTDNKNLEPTLLKHSSRGQDPSTCMPSNTVLQHHTLSSAC